MYVLKVSHILVVITVLECTMMVKMMVGYDGVHSGNDDDDGI